VSPHCGSTRVATVQVDLPATQQLTQWRHGFVLRATEGTLALDAAEGYSAAP